MVNAQDYNVYPLTLGNNVVRKVKAVNTTFAGNSRYFEMDDVTGHHSDLSITGTDGSVFIEDDGGIQPDYSQVTAATPVYPDWSNALKLSLSFNRDSGKSVDFIRNEISKAIRHPAIVNQYFYQYKYDATVNISVALSDGAYTKSPLNNLQIETTNPIDVEVGDFITLKGESDTIYYAKVIKVNSSDPAEIVLDKVITETGVITKICKNIRMKFTDAEIQAIRTQKIDDAQIQSFTLYYDLDTVTNTWGWNIWDGQSNITGKIIVFYKYEPGIRTNEAEYTAYIKGKKVVFESRDQVKFYYGNKDIVVDNETNLAERDKILINYYNPGDMTPATSNTTGSDIITVGYACDLENYTDNGSGGATFDAVFKYTGADKTLEFVENNPSQIGSPTYKHFLVSPDGLEY